MNAIEQTQEQATEELTVFVLVKTMPEWLGFSVDQRFAHFARYMQPILKKYEEQVRFTFYDTEFFSARVTDVWMRETPLWDRFFSIVEILAGVENAYARNYNRAAISA
jgi:Darcynin, domain of unknown function